MIDTEQLTAEMIDQMIEHPSVTVRDIGVIVRYLSEHRPEDEGYDRWARGLIKAQSAAGLGTFILDDLKGFIDGIRNRKKASA